MSASYKKLWKILIDRDMNKGDLIRQAKITSNIVAKMGKGEDVSMESLRKICIALDCEIGNIVEFVEEKKDMKKNESMSLFNFDCLTSLKNPLSELALQSKEI